MSPITFIYAATRTNHQGHPASNSEKNPTRGSRFKAKHTNATPVGPVLASIRLSIEREEGVALRTKGILVKPIFFFFYYDKC